MKREREEEKKLDESRDGLQEEKEVKLSIRIRLHDEITGELATCHPLLA